MKNLWIFVGLAGLGLIARADSLDNELKAFTAALNAKSSATNPEMAARMEMSGQQLESAAGMPDGENNLKAMVAQLMAANPAPEVQAAGKALLADLEARKKTRLEALKAKVDEVLNQAPEILAKAQKTQDLDGLISDLQKAQTNRGGYDQEAQAQMSRLTTAYQFVAQWQDYLSARNSGNIQLAQQTLQNILNYQRNGEGTLVPRSEILARNVELATGAKPAAPGAPPAPPPAVDESAIIAEIKSLDDLGTAVKALKAANPNNQSQTASALLQIASAYAVSKAGLPTTLDLNPVNYSNLTPAPELERVRAMALAYLLPRYLGAKALPPNPGEAVADYLNRSIDDAASRQDWVMLQHIITAETKITRSLVQTGGPRSFLAGLNQEMAGQYAPAVVSYNNALRDPDELLPAKVVGDRLAAIKKDHPAEYEEGMKTVNNPPPAPAYTNPMMMRSMMMQGYAMPGAPGAAGPAAAGHLPTATPAVTPPASTNAAPVAPAK